LKVKTNKTIKIMNKTFEQIESEIRSELTYTIYRGVYSTEDFLTNIIGKKVSLDEVKYDDCCGVDEEDEYVMKACYSTNDNEYNIHIFYGSDTEMIGCVDVIHRHIPNTEETYIYLLVDEYTYDDEKQEVVITPCISKEVAIQELQDRYEWYLKESYLSNFVDKDGYVIDTPDPAFAPAKGQPLVFYRDNRVIGGGIVVGFE
jgi:hypothetical protein